MVYRLLLSAFRKNRLAMVGAVLILLFTVVAVIGPWIVPHDPIEQNYRALLLPPSGEHLMGTDHLGRDVFSRVISGTRLAFLIGIGVVLLEGAIGTMLGAIAGFLGGAVDNILMRLVDTMLAIPAMVLAIVISGTFGGGIGPLIFTITIVSWTHFARLMRGEVLAESGRVYVEAARAIGASRTRILLRHILPNTISTAIVFSTLEIPWAILFSAGLSFLGVGVAPPTPEWGSIIANGRSYVTSAWWIATFPGLTMMLVVLGFNFLGDGLRDAFDPRLTRRT